MLYEIPAFRPSPEHRLDLLPGSYRIVFAVDGRQRPYPVEILPQPAMGEILRVDYGTDDTKRRAGFEFGGKQLELSDGGRFAAVTVARPGTVTWTVRKGKQMLWRSVSEGQQIAMVELPLTRLAPGGYTMEAITESDSRNAGLVLKPEAQSASSTSVVSLGANLAPASRFAFIGYRWLLRGKLDEPRRSLHASLAKAWTAEAQIELAHVDALTGSLDAARDRVCSVLAAPR